MKRILTIAGSDSGGGAGIQADLKTITVLGGYGMSVLTALTAQNTLGVQGVHQVPEAFIRLQMESVLSDIGADAAKTGMLATPGVVTVVAQSLARFPVPLLVVDPVMVAKSGDALLSEPAREALRERLLPLAHIVTPNLPEAEVLAAMPVRNLADMKDAAVRIHALGPRHVLVKGGHLPGDPVDLLWDGKTFTEFPGPRMAGRHTHGTGCTLSAALATFLGEGLEVTEAVARAKAFVSRAIVAGIPLGSGHGPTNPFAHVEVWKDRSEVLEHMEQALDRMAQEPLGGLVPEVRANLGYAIRGAISPKDVAAVPGRISQIGERILIMKGPAFGASQHIAKVILAAMGAFPQMRSAMNIRHDPEILKACRAAGFHLVSFSRKDEPSDIMELEGSTLEWGTRTALKGMEAPPDMIYDEGGEGKEPMIRILGTDPMDVVQKCLRVRRLLRPAP